jgi:hypothetical protein
MTKLRKGRWEKERENLKEERKIEYYVYDLLKDYEANKQKLQSIKKILEE